MTERPIITRAEAKRLGLPRYFTGQPCKHGHVAERWTNDGICCECSRLRAAKRMLDGKKSGKRGRSIYTRIRDNPEKYPPEYADILLEKERNRNRERQCTYREANRDAINARKRAYRARKRAERGAGNV